MPDFNDKKEDSKGVPFIEHGALKMVTTTNVNPNQAPPPPPPPPPKANNTDKNRSL